MTGCTEQDDAIRIAHGGRVVTFRVLEFGLMVEVEAAAIRTGEGEEALGMALAVPGLWT